MLGRLRLPLHATGSDVLARPLHHPNCPFAPSCRHVFLLTRDSTMAGKEWLHEGKSTDSRRLALWWRHRGGTRPESVFGNSGGSCL